MPNKENIFVYAVCGNDVYINTLNYSLRFLKYFSKNKIIVVTDSSRNNIAIENDHIIDIKTPKKYTHHQSSIYLKTSLLNYLDKSNNYCYLDSDVIAIDKRVDNIFDNNSNIISFAKDHCRFDEFSPSAVNCNCKKKSIRSINEFYELKAKYNPEFVPDAIFKNPDARKLYSKLYRIKQKPILNIHIILKYIFLKKLLPVKHFKLNKEFRFNKKNKVWLNNKNEIVLSDILSSHKDIEKNSAYKLDRVRRYWKDKDGKKLFNLTCNHLHKEILKKYNIKIKPENWQHWNGGVFLFNEKSQDFLDTWHKLTLNIFDDPYWKTRDQGTLAVTIWKYNLQNKQTLPINFNFIADFYKPEISYSKEEGFTNDNFNSSLEPYFIHVFNHFGDENWNIWNTINSKLTN